MEQSKKKYYLIHYWVQHQNGGNWDPVGEGIDKHPFEYMREDVKAWAERGSIYDVTLTGYREITEQEYKLYKELESDDDME